MANTVVYSVGMKQIFPNILNLVDATVSFAQGDLLVYDATNKLVRKAATEGESATLVGIAAFDAASGKPLSAYQTAVDASVSAPQMNGPMYGIVASMTLETGSTLSPGALVYGKPSLGAQYVATSGTKAIGVYQGKAIAGSAAGQVVEVLIGARYPGDALQF
jgi:hypothetical protein